MPSIAHWCSRHYINTSSLFLFFFGFKESNNLIQTFIFKIRNLRSREIQWFFSWSQGITIWISCSLKLRLPCFALLWVTLCNCQVLFNTNRNFPIRAYTLSIMIGISTILKRTLHPGVNIIFPFWKEAQDLRSRNLGCSLFWFWCLRNLRKITLLLWATVLFSVNWGA